MANTYASNDILNKVGPKMQKFLDLNHCPRQSDLDAAHWSRMIISRLLVPQFCRWRYIVVFPRQSNNSRVLSCLLFNRPGNTVTDRPLANETVPIKDEYRPERYYKTAVCYCLFMEASNRLLK